MDRRQAGRAGGINAVTGSAELEEVVDAGKHEHTRGFSKYVLDSPAGNERPVTTRDEVGINILRTVRLHPIVAGHSIKYANTIFSC